MAKKKAKAEEPVVQAEQQPEPVATEPQTSGKRAAGGRTIAAWRVEAMKHATHPKDIADRINEQAERDGSTYRTTEADIAKLLNKGKGKRGRKRKSKSDDTPLFSNENGQAGSEQKGSLTPSEPVKVSQQSEGEATAVLRDLVRLLGKDSTKRLIDGL